MPVTVKTAAEDLANHLFKLHTIFKRPIPERALIIYLIKRFDSADIPSILETAERLLMIARIKGTDKYLPAEDFASGKKIY